MNKWWDCSGRLGNLSLLGRQFYSEDDEGMWNADYMFARYREYCASKIDTTISHNETMYNEWYFEVGRSAADNVALAVLSSYLKDVRSVLDIPCGHGRVLRHLVKLFPSAEFDACDLDEQGVHFCSEQFNARGIVSCEDLTSMHFDRRYDVIWVGSLFTHVSRERTKAWLYHLSKFLSGEGIIVATVHGRWCEHVHKVAPYIEESSWHKIVNQYEAEGYGYADYNRSESHDFLSGAYGVSLAKPHVIISDLESMDGIRIFQYRERAWADHQDVVVVGKPSYDRVWPNMQ